jgi:hypothetical protein
MESNKIQNNAIPALKVLFELEADFLSFFPRRILKLLMLPVDPLILFRLLFEDLLIIIERHVNSIIIYMIYCVFILNILYYYVLGI